MSFEMMESSMKLTIVLPSNDQRTSIGSPVSPEEQSPNIDCPVSSSSSASDVNDIGGVQEESGLPMSKARCIALVATVTGASFLNTLSLQTVVIILPSISRELSIPQCRQQWLVSSYSITFGCFLLLWGRIADIYGKRLVFILGSFWVTIMTVVNPFVPNEIAFDLFRALHGLGAAANVPTAIGILGVIFPPGKAKNYAFSTYAAGAPIGSIFGNLLAGFVAEYANWKWVFVVSAFLAGTIAIVAIFTIPKEPPSSQHETGGRNETHPSIDWVGATLVTLGLIGLMIALTEGNLVGWSTPWVPTLMVIALIAVALFVSWQMYLERSLNSSLVVTRKPRPPLVKVSIFSNFRFSAVMVIVCLFYASFNNYLIQATYFFQNFQGLSPFDTMLRFIPMGVGGIIVAIIVSQLLGRIPTLFILVTGNLAVSIASLLFALPIPPTTSYYAYGLPAMLLSVIGVDTTWPCLTLFTSQALPPEDQAIGGALINAVGQFGRALGLAISTALQTSVLANGRHVSIKDAGAMKPWDPVTLNAMRAANWMNFAFGIASLAVVIMAFRSMEIVGKARSSLLVRSGSGQEKGKHRDCDPHANEAFGGAGNRK
ncbi:hypothetical protein RJ55_02464 [Drechmeria coniospora]|nr:hypothetical protein RJ55_02464 [Drechmeria coniospora]